MGLSASKRAAARAAMHAQRVLPRYLSVYELAVLLHRHEKIIYEWSSTAPERLPRVTRIAGRVLFDARDVERWFDEQRGDAFPFGTEGINEGPGRPKKAVTVARRNAASSR